MRLALVLVFAAVVGFGCTSGGMQLERAQSDTIAQEDLERLGQGQDLYSLLRRIRPEWLRKSGPHSLTGGDDIRVYVNGMRFETPESLRFYNATDAESVRFLVPGRATVRFGVGHSHGAIVVQLRGGGVPVP